ncbi:MAG: hypothetical protein H6705_04285 [Myxococcales bacterium]|nr:hypothetical protein [Myxococcales bacterium]
MGDGSREGMPSVGGDDAMREDAVRCDGGREVMPSVGGGAMGGDAMPEVA